MICECGERLLAAVGEETITTVEGERLTFRRRSDYVLCPACLNLYSMTRLRDEYPDGEYPEQITRTLAVAEDFGELAEVEDLDAYRSALQEEGIPLEN